MLGELQPGVGTPTLSTKNFIVQQPTQICKIGIVESRKDEKIFTNEKRHLKTPRA